MLSFGVRNYAHLIKNAVKIFGSLARRYKTAKGKVLYAEKPRPFSFTYREKKTKICGRVCENMPLNRKYVIRRATKITFTKKQFFFFYFIFYNCFTHTIYNATLILPTLHTLIKILTYIMFHYKS